MLEEERADPKTKNTFCKTFKEIVCYAVWPIVGMMFHPMYIVINATVAGRMEGVNLAALGLGSLTVGILVMSMNQSFAFVTSSFVAPAHGEGDFKLARKYLHRQLFLNLCVFVVLLAPVFWIKPLFGAIG